MITTSRKCNTKLGQFIVNNPNWRHILSEEPYGLKIKDTGPFVLFNYSIYNSDFNNEIVQEARGIIFENGSWESPVCHSFDKFGNYGESYVPDIDWSTAVVTEKIDGSLIRVWCDGSYSWRISTSGLVDAYEAKYDTTSGASFGNLFEKALANNGLDLLELFSNLNRGFTYMFELISPRTRVVIPHETTDCYFLGYRNNSSGLDVPFFQNSSSYDIKVLNKFKTPRIFSLKSLDDCIKTSQELPWDEEGYVVVDENLNRCKIKSTAYVLAHYSRCNGNVGVRKLIDVVLSGESAEFLIYASDYADRIDAITAAMKGFKQSCFEAKNQLLQERWESRKDFSSLVLAYPSKIRPYLFTIPDRDVTVDEFTADWTSSKWLTYIESEL